MKEEQLLLSVKFRVTFKSNMEKEENLNLQWRHYGVLKRGGLSRKGGTDLEEQVENGKGATRKSRC